MRSGSATPSASRGRRRRARPAQRCRRLAAARSGPARLSGSRVGGTPQSVVRAGTLGLPLTIAIIGGQPERFAPLVDLYRRSARGGRSRAARRSGWRSTPMRSWARAPRTRDRAFAHPYLEMMNRIGRERGWPPAGRDAVPGAPRAPGRTRRGVAASEVAEKILFEDELFGNDRYVGQMSVGAVAHQDVMRSMRAVRHRGRPGASEPRSRDERLRRPPRPDSLPPGRVAFAYSRRCGVCRAPSSFSPRYRAFSARRSCWWRSRRRASADCASSRSSAVAPLAGHARGSPVSGCSSFIACDRP